MAVQSVVSAVAAPEKPPQAANLKVYTASEMTEADVKACIARPRVDFTSILNTVTHQAPEAGNTTALRGCQRTAALAYARVPTSSNHIGADTYAKQ